MSELDPQTGGSDTARWPRVARAPGGDDHRVEVRGHRIGGGGWTVVAGPCAVESEEQLMPLARGLRAAGAHLLRGGAYKPRTRPTEFQGLGAAGLRLLARAGEATGLGTVSEAVDEASLEAVAESCDVVQIGARNMHNYELLKRAGRIGRPVLLKRGFSATLEDWLWAAEYVADAGNPDIVLCERGIRTFSDHSRFTLDLSVVPRVRALCRLPVLVDPSHASGRAADVPALARAAAAVGASGVMLEVHPEPAEARCDGPQSLTPEGFADLAADLRRVVAAVDARREVTT